MTQFLDPYHRFLGIPPHLQPPNYYRLLGLELFESNSVVIEDAAERQLAHVRKYEMGPDAAEVQELLGELAKARVCLLLPERKAAYDAALRKQIAAARPSKAPPALNTAISRPPNSAEEEELILHADPLPKAPFSSPAKPKPSGSGEPRRPAPMANGSRQSPQITVPRAIPAPQPATSYSPIEALTRNPAKEAPYMREYRRRFFETLFKVIVFIFTLVLLLLLFNALLLPWLKDSNSAPRPSSKTPAASSLTTKESSLPSVPVPALPEDDLAMEEDISQKPDFPAEERSEIDPEPKKVSIFTTIRTAFQNNEIRQTPFIGDISGTAFEDQYRDGGLLVALKMTWKKFGKNGESRAVASIQPEYLTSLGYVKGKVYGTPEKNGLRFLAKSGYAIGGLKINYTPGGQSPTGRIIGVRVIFMRQDGDRLDPQDSYLGSSYPLDSSVPLLAPEIVSNGDLAVGLFGSTSEEDLCSLGLFLLKTANSSSPSTDPNQTPQASSDAASAAETLSPDDEDYYVGSWFIYEDGRFASTVIFSGNHTARDRRYHREGGKWEFKNNQVRILWKDGWKDVFERDGDKFRKYSFAPSDPNEHIPTNEGTAVKSSTVVD